MARGRLLRLEALLDACGSTGPAEHHGHVGPTERGEAEDEVEASPLPSPWRSNPGVEFRLGARSEEADS
ncbi:hypothetical protein [Terriglobus sp.]|uniref:hypothetical protein n=1 Tax=Terriglobus sp. TaxID=1889013 RepID=UPI003B00A7D9